MADPQATPPSQAEIDNGKLHAMQGTTYQWWVDPYRPDRASCFDAEDPLFSVPVEILFVGVNREPNRQVIDALETAFICGQKDGEISGALKAQAEIRKALGV